MLLQKKSENKGANCIKLGGDYQAWTSSGYGSRTPLVVRVREEVGRLSFLSSNTRTFAYTQWT